MIKETMILQKIQNKIKQVIENKNSTVDITKEAEVSKGTIINSEFLNGLKSEEATEQLSKFGKKKLYASVSTKKNN